jgi:hypothetical protein
MGGSFLLLALLLQDPTAQLPPADAQRDHELIAQLLVRVQQLESELQALKASRNPTAPATGSPVAAQPASGGKAPSSLAPAAPRESEMQGMAAGGEFPTMQFRGFSDVSYKATDFDGGTNTFALGQMTLFITSNLSDRVSVIAEPVLEADERNAFNFELERLLLQLTANEHFKVSVGRYHTAIGWYNTAYHHSAWLQTAIGRPFLFQFEDNGGILPIHNVGVSVTGQIPSGRLRLRYVAEIGNGRASRSRLDEPTQNDRDENNGKAVNGALLARPDWAPGLQLGFSTYHDRLTPLGSPKVDETIFATHAVYQTSGLEWLNEVVVVRHAVDGGGVSTSTGFYTQASKPFGRLRPYIRYQHLDVPETDAVFPDIGRMSGPSIGLRYDLNQFSAFKFQYDFVDRGSKGVNAVVTQLSFVF